MQNNYEDIGLKANYISPDIIYYRSFVNMFYVLISLMDEYVAKTQCVTAFRQNARKVTAMRWWADESDTAEAATPSFDD